VPIVGIGIGTGSSVITTSAEPSSSRKSLVSRRLPNNTKTKNIGTARAFLFGGRQHRAEEEFQDGLPIGRSEVLRITILDTPSEQKWILQGRLIGPWAAELKASWNERDGANGRARVVDLREVTFVDGNGEKVLMRMMQDDAQFIVGGVYATHVVENLWARCKNRLRASNLG
jgi:hypothetical protein